ncbi:MAG: hypothetical protein AAGF12_18170 [Myxococcota bacterium]
MIYNSRLEVVQRVGSLAGNSRLTSTPTGFAAIGAEESVSDAVITFLDRCP